MRSLTKLAALAALQGCAIQTSFSDTPNHWTVSSAAICQGQPGQVLLTPKDPVTLTDKSGKVVVPLVAAVLNGASTPLSATWNGTALVAVAPANLPAGIYDVTIAQQNQNAVTLSAALQVAGVPSNLSVLGQAACPGQSGAQSFTITGTNVGALTGVTLTGANGGTLSTAFANNTLTVTVSLADKSEGSEYAINVSNGDGCSAPYAGQGFEVEPAPTVTDAGVVAGPHLKSGPLAQNAPVTVRIPGTSLNAGTLVQVGGVSPNAVVASPGVTDGSSIDVSFSANALALGSGQAISVANGSCVASVAATVDVGAPDFSVSRISPNAWDPMQMGAFFDVFGDDLSDAGGIMAGSPNNAILWIDTDTSIFTDNWQPVNGFVQLDALGNALRFANASTDTAPSVTVFGATNAELTSFDGTSHEAWIENFQLLQTPAPRIVWKDKDWIAANGSVSDTVTVYGCGLVGASFKLIDAADGDVPSGALIPTSASDGSWSEAQFKCTNGNGGDFVADVISLQANGVARGGPYRIRAFIPAASGMPEIDADDLYPITGYDEANLTLSETNVTVPPLVDARKNPNSLVAGDATGRRYLYIVGGYGDAGSDPSAIGGADATYEYSALDPSNALLGWQELDSTDAFPLTGDDHAAAYGMAAVADGTRLYFAGGAATSTAGICTNPQSKTCNASAHVRQAGVVDPTSGSPTSTTPAGQLSTLASPSSGKSSTNPTKDVVTSMCNGNCDTTASFGDFRYGAQAQVLSDSTGTRKLLVFGGFKSSDMLAGSNNSGLVYAFDLGADGLITNAGTTDVTPPALAGPTPTLFPQAAQALAVQSGGANLIATLHAVFGFANGANESQPIQHVTVAPAPLVCDAGCNCTNDWEYCVLAETQGSGAALNPATCESSHACFETGFGGVAIGNTMLMLGGTARAGAPGNTSWPGYAQAQNTILSITPAQDAPEATTLLTTLKLRRTLAATISIPPYIGLVSGVMCSEDFPPGAPGCTLNTETAPGSATAEIFELH